MLSVWEVLDFVFQRDHTTFVTPHFNLMSLRPEILATLLVPHCLSVCLFVLHGIVGLGIGHRMAYPSSYSQMLRFLFSL